MSERVTEQEVEQWVAAVNATAAAVDHSADPEGVAGGLPAQAGEHARLMDGYALLAQVGPEGLERLEELRQAGGSTEEAAAALGVKTPGEIIAALAQVTPDSPVAAEADDGPDFGYVPGKGSAYDYIPAWMKVPGFHKSKALHDPPYAVVKLFTPDSSWTWYVLEYYGKDDDIAFGLVRGFETELGDFSLAEMREVKGPWGLHIERDLWFRPTLVTELPEYKAEWGDDGPYLTRKAPKKPAKVAAAAEPAQYHTLAYGDNGSQVYFEGERYLLANPYLDRDGQRYASGWCWFERDGSGEFLCVPDPGEEHSCIGALSLKEAVTCAERVLGVRFELTGAPPDLPDSYPIPPMWEEGGSAGADVQASPAAPALSPWADWVTSMAQVGGALVAEAAAQVAAEVAADSASTPPEDFPAWKLTKREYQESKAMTVAGGVPILNAADAKEHCRIVEEALACGCPISTHVLKDYPDLWKPWTWPLEHWLRMEHTVQRTGPDMRYIAPTGDKVLWPGTNSREKAIRAQHRYEVERALQRGDPVPFCALAGYPDLPAKSPSCPTCRSARDLPSTSADTPEPGSPQLAQEKDGGPPVELMAPPAVLGKAEASYSGDIISDAQRVKRPVSLPPLDGLWVCVGAVHRGDQIEQVDCRQVVPLAEYTGGDAWRGQRYEGGYTGRIVRHAKTEYVITDREIVLKPAPDDQADLDAPLEDAVATATPKKAPRLPDGIPPLIEVDLGRSEGWKPAEVVRVNDRWLHYRFPNDGKENHKVQLIARDILWREAAATA
jgi:hypothetical protein